MTIVAWDGHWLSCDSRVTTYARNRKTQERRKKGHRSNANKIAKYGTLEEHEQLYFRDQIVVATARCGSVNTTKAMSKVLESGKDLEAVFERRYKRGALSECRSGSLFIVTDQSSWHFRFSSVSGISVKEIGSNKFAMGADSRTTLFLMRQFNLDAMNAAAAATLMSRKSGGNIKTIKRSKKNPVLVEESYMTETKDKDNLRMQIRNAIAMLAID